MPGRIAGFLATSSTTGTGVVKTELNGAVALRVPTLAPGHNSQYVGDVYWYHAPTGAFTVDQSSIQSTFIESEDVLDLGHKEYVLPAATSGDGAFTVAAVPLIHPVPYNFYADGGQNLRLWAQSQIANTAGFRVGAGLMLHEGGKPANKPQMYYTASADETLTSTTAARIAGGDITINHQGTLVTVACRVGNTVATASESLVGYNEIYSAQFTGIQTHRFAIQPVGAGLGATASLLNPGDFDVHPIIPFERPCTINVWYNMEEALTGDSAFIHCVGYTKPGM